MHVRHNVQLVWSDRADRCQLDHFRKIASHGDISIKFFKTVVLNRTSLMAVSPFTLSYPRSHLSGIANIHEKLPYKASSHIRWLCQIISTSRSGKSTPGFPYGSVFNLAQSPIGKWFNPMVYIEWTIFHVSHGAHGRKLFQQAYAFLDWFATVKFTKALIRKPSCSSPTSDTLQTLGEKYKGTFESRRGPKVVRSWLVACQNHWESGSPPTHKCHYWREAHRKDKWYNELSRLWCPWIIRPSTCFVLKWARPFTRITIASYSLKRRWYIPKTFFMI